MTNPTSIDLFAGCGGMTQGFADVGFDPVLAVESNLAAAATYAANFGETHVFAGDIADVDRSRGIPEADLVIGGPPCQGFSSLGSRDPKDPRNQLWDKYVDVVLAADPKVFVLENVDRFVKSPEFGLLMAELAGGRLKRWNDFECQVLNAADFGVPQRRKRTILIASRVGPILLPDPTHADPGLDGRASGGGEHTSLDDRLPPWQTVRDAFAGVPFETGPTFLPDRTTTFFGQQFPGEFKSTEIHIGRSPMPISELRYEYIAPGRGRRDLPHHLLPPCWKKKRTGTTDVMGRMQWDRPSLTIRTEFFKPEKGRYLHPQWHPDDPDKQVNRSITHLEAARLQTFPDDFVWCGPKLEIARQIGNAVPPVLAQAIARQVLATIS